MIYGRNKGRGYGELPEQTDTALSLLHTYDLALVQLATLAFSLVRALGRCILKQFPAWRDLIHLPAVSLSARYVMGAFYIIGERS